MLLLFCGFSVLAQPVILKRSHSIQPKTGARLEAVKAPDSVTIIAVRVSFQADENRLTSGNGTFEENSLPYLNNHPISIDPLPHDRSYFEAHLEFAKNYFAKVSDGQFSINYRVLPEVYQLDEPMETYSPTGESFSNEKLAMLTKDVWQKVEESGGFDASGLNPDQTAFVIFHAGVGRDVQLTGTTLDITPQDIPSISLDRQTLSSLLEDPSFEGFPINGGSFQVTNSLIIPRTLSRRGEDVTGTEFVLQLSINGLLCASIGSYLGLPDLFNTETGDSGIGRFGLMDGESFFSYRGLFPPEPSAWEKKYLGWQTVFHISFETESQVQLPAASQTAANSIAQYNLSSEEYFLIENRHRDPLNDGITLTTQRPDGSIQQQNFRNNDQAFVNQEQGFEELLEPGVLINTDNFDWSLPGGLDIGKDEVAGTDDDRFLNGGVLIWHIDEAIIQNQIENQAVNANPEQRGVDLEEADGAQDIGRAANDTFSNQARGWAFDFWWNGNDARVVTLQGDTLTLYQNRFSSDTQPSNQSNSGADSYFELYDFSDNLPTATFRIRPISGETVQPLVIADEPVPGNNTYILNDDELRAYYPPELSIYTAQSDTFLVIPTQTDTYARILTDDTQNGYFDFNQPRPQQPFIGSQLVLADASDESSTIDLNAWNWDGTAWTNNWQTTVNANKGFISSTEGDTLSVDFTQDRVFLQTGAALPPLNNPQQQSLSISGKASILQPGNIQVSGTSFSEPVDTEVPRIYTGALQLEPGRNAFFLLSDTQLSIIDPESPNPLRTVAESSLLGWPAFVDFSGDQRLDFLYVDQETGQLIGKHGTGALIDFFPIHPPPGGVFTGTPLLADIDGDGLQDVLVAAQNSVAMTIHAYDRQGEEKEGFPLLVGSVTNPIAQPIHPIISGQTLYAVSHTGDLKAWVLPKMQDVLWNSAYGNEPFNKVTGRIAGTESPASVPELLVKEETYNWPNPASEITNIRYQVREGGTVDIKIITPGGRVVYSESYEVSGGAPEEQQIATSDWGSGIYLAMVTATVGNQKESKMIKIAVVH